jgi:hypothetical protein
MSRTIELKDEVFARLQQIAERDGVTPEIWIETLINEKSNGRSQKPTLEITDEERKELHEFHHRMEKKLGEMWREKYRRQLAKFNERNPD